MRLHKRSVVLGFLTFVVVLAILYRRSHNNGPNWPERLSCPVPVLLSEQQMKLTMLPCIRQATPEDAIAAVGDIQLLSRVSEPIPFTIVWDSAAYSSMTTLTKAQWAAIRHIVFHTPLELTLAKQSGVLQRLDSNTCDIHIIPEYSRHFGHPPARFTTIGIVVSTLGQLSIVKRLAAQLSNWLIVVLCLTDKLHTTASMELKTVDSVVIRTLDRLNPGNAFQFTLFYADSSLGVWEAAHNGAIVVASSTDNVRLWELLPDYVQAQGFDDLVVCLKHMADGHGIPAFSHLRFVGAQHDRWRNGYKEILPAQSPSSTLFPPANLTIAAIMDPFSWMVFQPEFAHMYQLDPDKWQQQVAGAKPDLVLVESAWHGMNGLWSKLLRKPFANHHRDQKLGVIRELTQWAEDKGIPTLFWNKEDPPNFDVFIDCAVLFKYVFTTDAESVPRYEERGVKPGYVMPLPFAVQPRLVNPIGSRKLRSPEVIFAGSWRADKYPKRTEFLGSVLDAMVAAGSPVKVLDRFSSEHGNKHPKGFFFPDRFLGILSHGVQPENMPLTYKKYALFLNVNSVTHSTTMSSRRPYELIASGTPCLSNFASSLAAMVDVVPDSGITFVSDPSSAIAWVNKYINSQDEAYKSTRGGQRVIFEKHTLRQRVGTVLWQVGLPELSLQMVRLPFVQIRVNCKHATIQCVNEASSMYYRQRILRKSLLITVDHQTSETALTSLRRVSDPSSAATIRLERSLPRCSSCTAISTAHAFELVAFMDPKHTYAPEFLTDSVMAFQYAIDAEVVGRATFTGSILETGNEYVSSALLHQHSLVVRSTSFLAGCNHEPDATCLPELYHRLGFKGYGLDRFAFTPRKEGLCGT